MVFAITDRYTSMRHLEAARGLGEWLRAIHPQQRRLLQSCPRTHRSLGSSAASEMERTPATLKGIMFELPMRPA
jgi:hypothetical protein